MHNTMVRQISDCFGGHRKIENVLANLCAHLPGIFGYEEAGVILHNFSGDNNYYALLNPGK